MGQWQELNKEAQVTLLWIPLLLKQSYLFLSLAFLLWRSRPTRLWRLPNDAAEQLGLRTGTWTWWFSWRWLGRCLYTQRVQDFTTFYARRWVRRLCLSLKCCRFKNRFEHKDIGPDTSLCYPSSHHVHAQL